MKSNIHDNKHWLSFWVQSCRLDQKEQGNLHRAPENERVKKERFENARKAQAVGHSESGASGIEPAASLPGFLCSGCTTCCACQSL